MSNPNLPSNPFATQWLSMASAAPWGGAFTGEWQRQQMAALEAWNRQVLGFWMGVLAPAARPSAVDADARPHAEPRFAAALGGIEAPAVQPEPVALAGAEPPASAVVSEPEAPAPEAELQAPKPKASAGLRAAVKHRKGPAPKATTRRHPARH